MVVSLPRAMVHINIAAEYPDSWRPTDHLFPPPSLVRAWEYVLFIITEQLKDASLKVSVSILKFLKMAVIF
jgi:hypothetical protein